jgi:hypothetical protein
MISINGRYAGNIFFILAFERIQTEYKIYIDATYSSIESEKLGRQIWKKTMLPNRIAKKPKRSVDVGAHKAT